VSGTVRLELRGAGGERVGLVRTLLSHGVAELLPNVVAEDGTRLEMALAGADGRVHAVRLEADGDGVARLTGIGDGDPAAVADAVRRMLRLDEDLSAFYARAEGDEALAWAAEEGAGRMLSSPTVFEDVVKTICTTNCTWSATVRMVSALVSNLGAPAVGAAERHAFPTPAAMAEAPEELYRDVARCGYRGAYLRAIAADAADGTLDLEALIDPAIDDEEAAQRLLALPGVGPYACAHMMMLLGRYERLILDSWTRPTYARLAGRKSADRTIERRFKRYGRYAGLAFWLFLTRGWVPAAA
jgi:N-glycosylase/DNA lyase